MKTTILRGCVIAWLLFIAAGVAIDREPLFGAFGGTARNALAALTLRPGMAVFKNSVVDEKVEAHCAKVTGQRPNGERVVLYAPECPRRHFLWRTDPEDQLMQRIARNTHTAHLRGEQAPLTADSPFDARRFAALADYYCHGRSNESYAAVELRHHRIARDIKTGEHVARPNIVCRYECRQRGAAAPRCSAEGSWPGGADPGR